MDREQRLRSRCNNTETERKSHEINGRNLYTKRKKTRESKQKRYLNEWLENSSAFQQTEEDYEGVPDHSQQASGYWPPHSSEQRMVAALSDPSVGQYSVPVGFYREPIFLPTYPVYPSAAVPFTSSRHNMKPPARATTRPHHCQRQQRSSYPPPVDVCLPHRMCTRSAQSNHVHRGVVPELHPNPDVGSGHEYTSLPQVTQNTMLNLSRRRFSDPGLGPNANCNESSESSSTGSSRESPPPDVQMVRNLAQQVSALQESNQLLFRQLQETREQFESLKSQVSSLAQLAVEYEPGMVSGLVREVRDAAKVREEALLSKVYNMLGNAERKDLCQRTIGAEKLQKYSTDIQEIKDQMYKAALNRLVCDDRLTRLEQQMQNLHLNMSSHGPASAHQQDASNQDGFDVEQGTPQILDLPSGRVEADHNLQDDLCNSIDATKIADDVPQAVNGVNEDVKYEPISLEQSPSSLDNSSESSSSLGSGSVSRRRSSIHSPQVTMSGPVTDL